MESKMKIKKDIPLKGRFIIELLDEHGKRKSLRIVENVVVNVGKSYLAEWLTQPSQSDYFMQYIALGTGMTAASASDLGLETELPTRVVGTLSFSGAIWQNQAFFGPGVDTGTITEAAIFSDASGGTMMARQVFPAVIKGAGEGVLVTWQITIV